LRLARVDGRIKLLADNGEGKKLHSSNGVVARLGNAPWLTDPTTRSWAHFEGRHATHRPVGWVPDPSGVSVLSPLEATALGLL